MVQAISPIINPDEFVLLNQQTRLVVIDARTGPDANANYATQHLKGALHVDLDTELAAVKADASKGGRHPLPEPEKFAAVLTRLGISPESHVVVYDDKNASNAAARFWWMLVSAGHQKIQVVNGGFAAAIAAGFPTSSNIEHRSSTEPYGVINWGLPLANMNEVAVAAQDDESVVIDVRDRERYNGEKEPIDLVAGHIPGAINIPFSNNLDSNGFFLAPEKLKEIYTQATGNKNSENIIVHCGSGVTACHTILAMAHAGLPISKLYVGSWSEWSRCNMPIATTAKP